jgi:hypothetical protein
MAHSFSDFDSVEGACEERGVCDAGLNFGNDHGLEEGGAKGVCAVS